VSTVMPRRPCRGELPYNMSSTLWMVGSLYAPSRWEASHGPPIP
jgi:hypothetical protein